MCALDEYSGGELIAKLLKSLEWNDIQCKQRGISILLVVVAIASPLSGSSQTQQFNIAIMKFLPLFRVCTRRTEFECANI